jgi:asparagine synthase (glutamine-hydrolysing)
LRVPFLDSDVLEFAASLPEHFKVRGWPPKRILRAALKNKVPLPILKRKKIGFPVPYSRWLRTELKEMVHDTIHGHRGGLTEYFDRAALKGLTDSFFKGDMNAQEIFCLLVLALLNQQFVDAPSIKFG